MSTDKIIDSTLKIVFGFLSIIACIHVCMSIHYHNKQNIHKKHEKTNIILQIIFGMCIVDGIFAFIYLLIGINQLIEIKDNEVSDAILYTCLFITYVLSPIWHIILPYFMYGVLKDYDISILKRKEKYFYGFNIAVKELIDILHFILHYMHAT